MQHIVIQKVSQKVCPSPYLLKKWARLALSTAHKKNRFEVTIRIVDSEEMTYLNATYRKKSGPTNVLSFPMQIPAGVKMLKTPLGDIVICTEVVDREALQQGKAVKAHWAHMVIHGILHLLGHDHQQEDEAIRMESLERQLLQQLGFPDPYHGEHLTHE
jgi:probable rRNA maturation factor